MRWRAVVDAAADLAWGGSCAACGRPGPVCCPACERAVRGLAPRNVRSDDSVGPVWARGDYAADLRALILACKERQGLGLVPLLGDLALGSAAGLIHDGRCGEALLLVPVPSSRARVAERGFDLTWLMAKRVSGRLRRLGLDIRAARGLTMAAGVRDQVGLGVAARAANRLDGIRARTLAPARVLLLDDIVTTGATLTAAAQTLTTAGHAVLGAAVVAATPRLDGRSRSG